MPFTGCTSHQDCDAHSIHNAEVSGDAVDLQAHTEIIKLGSTGPLDTCKPSPTQAEGGNAIGAGCAKKHSTACTCNDVRCIVAQCSGKQEIESTHIPECGAVQDQEHQWREPEGCRPTGDGADESH